MSSAWSIDHSPGPMTASSSPQNVSVITYSQPSPGRKMKKPLPRWLVIQATSITPITAAPASGVSRPSSSSEPPTISVMLASQAWRMPASCPGWRTSRPSPRSCRPGRCG